MSDRYDEIARVIEENCNDKSDASFWRNTCADILRRAFPPVEPTKDAMELAVKVYNTMFGEEKTKLTVAAALIEASLAEWKAKEPPIDPAIIEPYVQLRIEQDRAPRQSASEPSGQQQRIDAGRQLPHNTSKLPMPKVSPPRADDEAPSNKTTLLAIQAVVDLWDELPPIALMPADNFEREMARREAWCGKLLGSIRTLLASHQSASEPSVELSDAVVDNLLDIGTAYEAGAYTTGTARRNMRDAIKGLLAARPAEPKTVPMGLLMDIAQEANDGGGQYRVVQPEDFLAICAHWGFRVEEGK